jgi:hypothetical protein
MEKRKNDMQSDYERTGKLQRKIDIFYRDAGGWKYACSTNWWRTCQDAAENWRAVRGTARLDSKGRHIVKARFA